MKENRAVLLLFLASFLWGMAFIFQRLAVGKIGPVYFTALRMLLGFVALLPIVCRIFRRHKGDKQYRHDVLLGGLLCGFFTAVPSIIQQVGLNYTTAGKAGFLTSLYILFVPVFSIFLGKKVSRKTWICIFCAFIGTSFLCRSAAGKINIGDILILLCACLFAVQIMFIDYFSKKLEGFDLSSLQFLFAGLFSLIVAPFTETLTFQAVKDSIIPILYMGIVSSAIAYSFQVIGQKYVAPAKATLPLSLENAWSAIGGALFLHETMTSMELTGCLIMFASVIIAQVNGKKKEK